MGTPSHPVRAPLSWSRRWALLLSPALLFASETAFAQKPVPAAKLSYKLVTTDGWKAELPDTWKLERRRRYGHDASRGLWVYASKNRNFQLRVRVRKKRGEDFKKVASTSLARMLARMSRPEVLTSKVTDQNGHQLAIFLIKGGMLRNKYVRPYFVFRMLTQGEGGRPVRLAITLSGSHERLDTFMGVYERVMKRFELAQPKETPALKAIRAARAAAARKPAAGAAPLNKKN